LKRVDEFVSAPDEVRSADYAFDFEVQIAMVIGELQLLRDDL